jgi:hypothetical protein
MLEWKLDRLGIPTPTTVAYQGGVHETLGGGLVLDVMSRVPEEPGQPPKALSWKALTEAEWQLLKRLCEADEFMELSGPEGEWVVRPYMGRLVPDGFPAAQVMKLR